MDGTAVPDSVQGDGTVLPRGGGHRSRQQARCTKPRMPGQLRVLSLPSNSPGALEQRREPRDARRRGAARFDTRTNQTTSGSTSSGTSSTSRTPILPAARPAVQPGIRERRGPLRSPRRCVARQRQHLLRVDQRRQRGQGQICEYDPVEERVRLLFESPSARRPQRAGQDLREPARRTRALRRRRRHRVRPWPDDRRHDLPLHPEQRLICARRRVERVRPGLHRQGVRGACYSPDGKWLFVNCGPPVSRSRSRVPGEARGI